MRLSVLCLHLYFVFNCKNGSSLIFRHVIFTFTKLVLSYNMEVGSSLILEISSFIFISIQTCQPPHPPSKHISKFKKSIVQLW
jgi:hypothetical protein